MTRVQILYMVEPEYIDDWTNHGDVNPFLYGGNFVEYSNGEWRVVETQPIDHRGEQLIEVYHISKDKVWKDGEPIEDEKHFHPENPDKGWAIPFREALEKLGYTHPDHPTDMNTIRKVLCTLTNDLEPTEKYTINDNKEEYWEELSSYGIKEEKF